MNTKSLLHYLSVTLIAPVILVFTVSTLNAQTPVPTQGTGRFFIVTSDGQAEYCWESSGIARPEIEIMNIGSNPVTLRLTSGINETTPLTPTPTDLEYILPSLGVVTLPKGVDRFCHRAGSGAPTSMSLLVLN